MRQTRNVKSVKGKAAFGSRASGFTLLEVMVALAVAGLVLTALFAVYSTVMDAAESVQGRASAMHTARLALARLSQDLDSVHTTWNATDERPGDQPARIPPWQTFEGASPALPLNDNNATILAFPTTSGLDFSGSFPGHTLYRVIYTLNRAGGDTPEELYTLQRKQVPFPYLRDETRGVRPGGTRLTVMNRIKELSLRFITQGSAPPKDAWSPEEQSSPKQAPFPDAVRVELILQDRQNQTHRLELTAVLPHERRRTAD